MQDLLGGSCLMANEMPKATSNDPWGPTGTQMSEIAQMTFNSYVSLMKLDQRAIAPETEY